MKTTSKTTMSNEQGNIITECMFQKLDMMYNDITESMFNKDELIELRCMISNTLDTNYKKTGSITKGQMSNYVYDLLNRFEFIKKNKFILTKDQIDVARELLIIHINSILNEIEEMENETLFKWSVDGFDVSTDYKRIIKECDNLIEYLSSAEMHELQSLPEFKYETVINPFYRCLTSAYLFLNNTYDTMIKYMPNQECIYDINETIEQLNDEISIKFYSCRISLPVMDAKSFAELLKPFGIRLKDVYNEIDDIKEYDDGTLLLYDAKLPLAKKNIVLTNEAQMIIIENLILSVVKW